MGSSSGSVCVGQSRSGRGLVGQSSFARNPVDGGVYIMSSMIWSKISSEHISKIHVAIEQFTKLKRSPLYFTQLYYDKSI